MGVAVAVGAVVAVGEGSALAVAVGMGVAVAVGAVVAVGEGSALAVAAAVLMGGDVVRSELGVSVSVSEPLQATGRASRISKRAVKSGASRSALRIFVTP